MADLIFSILKYFKNKASTTLFAIYFSFWAIMHSEGIITILFTSQDYIFEKFGMLKNEYVYTYFFGAHPYDITWWLKVCTPFLLTYLYVKFFARFVLNPAYEIETKYKIDRKIIKARAETRYQKELNKLEKTLVEKEQNKAALQEAHKRQNEADPTAKWKLDYEDLSKKQDIDKIIKDFKSLIYTHNGRIRDGYGNNTIDVRSLSICESYGLFIRNAKNSGYIDVTDKGWFFIRKHDQ